MYIMPKDSRQRYTKQCLFDAFIRALEKKAVSDITVIEVSEDASISRKTFYKYYSDQFALLKAMQDDLFFGFTEEMKELPSNVLETVPTLINFISEHRVVVRAALENRGKGNFIDRVIRYLYDAYGEGLEKANPSLTTKNVEFLFYYIMEGLVGIIRLWLFSHPELSTEEIAEEAKTLMQLSLPAK